MDESFDYVVAAGIAPSMMIGLRAARFVMEERLPKPKLVEGRA